MPIQTLIIKNRLPNPNKRTNNNQKPRSFLNTEQNGKTPLKKQKSNAKWGNGTHPTLIPSRRSDMKKKAAVIFALCLFLTLLNGYCSAQVAGLYPVTFEEKASIKGVGKMTWSEDGWLEINSSGTWINSWDYQGTTAIDEKGNKLYMEFNAAGIEELEDCLVDWAYDEASKEGISAYELNFSLSIPLSLSNAR